MTTTRGRRIVRWASVALLLVTALVAWASSREAPELRQSLPLRIEMTQDEVAAVMGSSGSLCAEDNRGLTMLYGQAELRKLTIYSTVQSWTGDLLPAWSPSLEDWPVRVQIDRGGKVDRIERGSEVEVATAAEAAQ